jgi:Domain of Unknown Function (DUF1080)
MPQLQPPENWNRMEVRLHGRRLRVLVNGTQVQNLDLDQIPERPITRPYLKRSQGTIEFSKLVGTVRLRNLEWCDLSNTPPPTDPVSPARVVAFPQGKQAVGYGDGEWLREGDELVQTGSNPGVCLIFGDVEWTDYDFSCDAMRVNGPNGFDIIFRAPDKYNWEVFAVGTWNNTRHAWASLNENVGTPLKQSRNAGVNANEWHKVRVSVRGSRCQCFLDDIRLFDFTDQNHLRGAVGFRTWATKARFRNIKVTAPDGRVLWEGVPELNAANAGKEPVQLEADGFVPLFNGKDLIGWKTHRKQPGNWRVVNGILTGSGPAASYLYTERDDYKDFHLRVEAQINNGGNSGLYFRTVFGPQVPANNPSFPLGYEAQINGTHRDPNKTGSLYAGASGAVVSVRESPVPPGQWFTQEVIAEGNHIIIKVNGKTTADYTDDKRLFTRGHLALQQHNPQTVAEFRKIEIKELP